MSYMDFLRSKIVVAPDSGIDISEADISPVLKPHQRDSVLWGVRGGRRAWFEAFGLGKTLIQLESLRLILAAKGGKALVICPLGVKQEFAHDARMLGLEIEYVRTAAEAAASSHSILITNYERVRDGDLNPLDFTACSLDEASVLRGYGTKTYQEFLSKFRGVPFKFVATATPSPNRFKELIHYAVFLEIMDTGQALTRFFQRDSTKAGNLTLYPHKEEEFWLWMSTWALFVTRPSDLGYSDEGYDLPPMDIQYHMIKVDHGTAGADDDGQVKLFRDAALGLRDAAKEKRDSIDARLECMREIVEADPESHYVLWHTLENERHAIKRAIPEAVEVYGSQDLDEREQRVIDFSEGRIRLLASKPEISGSGCNFQYHCHKAIFLGINYQFHDFIQAIHRVYRFLQSERVEIHVIYAESESAILDALKAKWIQHNTLVAKMSAIIKEYGLSSTSVAEKLARTIGIGRAEYQGKRFVSVLNDSVLEMERLDDNSVDLIHTSIPFSNHYEYTASYNDFGHNRDNDAFFEQMDYLTPHLLRVLKPGRVAAIHCKDRILFGNATGTGMPSVDPFHATTIFHYMRHGFQFMGQIIVLTDVVRENNQTYRLGWSEQCKDGSKMGIGCPEYVLLFRKLPSDLSTAYADTPVAKSKKEYTRGRWQIDAHAFWRSSGDRLAMRDELFRTAVPDLQEAYRQFSRHAVYDYHEHVDLSEDLDAEGKLPASFAVVAPGSWSPDIWDDINRMRTLNGEQARKDLQFHICPLQFDIVERIINRFSNPGELVLDPFAGLGTVPYMAVKMERRGYGIELNYESFKDGLAYLKAADEEAAAPTLFEMEAVGNA